MNLNWFIPKLKIATSPWSSLKRQVWDWLEGFQHYLATGLATYKVNSSLKKLDLSISFHNNSFEQRLG